MTQHGKQKFDFEAFKKQTAARLKSGETLLGKDGVFTLLLKEFLKGELEAYIDQEEDPNRKNGNGKRSKRRSGDVELTTPRDRTFGAEIFPKGQKTLGVDLDRQIIALYARRSSYSDIRDHLTTCIDWISHRLR